MVILVIFLAIFVMLEGIIVAEILYRSKHPAFIFEIDDHDPDDVKFSMKGNVDVKPGRVYFLKAVRK